MHKKDAVTPALARIDYFRRMASYHEACGRLDEAGGRMDEARAKLAEAARWRKLWKDAVDMDAASRAQSEHEPTTTDQSTS